MMLTELALDYNSSTRHLVPTLFFFLGGGRGVGGVDRPFLCSLSYPGTSSVD